MGHHHTATPTGPKQVQRVRAVLARFQGQPAAAICRQYRLCRSALLTCRQRALMASHPALADRQRGPHRPHHRLAAAYEHAVVSLCHDHPTWSAYHVQRRGGRSIPSPRTLLRVRKRQGLARWPIRARVVLPDRRFAPLTRSRTQAIVQEKPSPGSERLAWDVRNGEPVTVSPATITRIRMKR